MNPARPGIKQALTMGKILNEGSYFLPGVGTARMGYDGIRDFGRGNWMGGAANLLGAATSLVPVVGGMAGRGIAGAGRLLSRAGAHGASGLSRMSAPTFGKALGSSFSGAGNLLQRGGPLFNRGVGSIGRGFQNQLQRVPGVGGPLASASNWTGNMMRQRPMASMMTGAGATVGLGMGQQRQDIQHQAQQEYTQQMPNMLNQLRGQMSGYNPMTYGYNPHLAF
jgi:hypothetical protein